MISQFLILFVSLYFAFVKSQASIISTVAGNNALGYGYSGDGGQATSANSLIQMQ